MKITLKEAQNIFNTNINELLINDNPDFIEQNHFGDYLIEEFKEGNEKARLWKDHKENGGTVQIEYYGALNSYTWQTVLK